MPAFMNLFGFAAKQEAHTTTDTTHTATAEVEREIVCDGEVCKALDRRSSVKTSSIPPELRSSKKNEKPLLESEEHEKPDVEPSPAEKPESPAAETTAQKSCTTNGSQPIFCRILALLRLRKFSTRCSLPTPTIAELTISAPTVQTA